MLEFLLQDGISWATLWVSKKAIYSFCLILTLSVVYGLASLILIHFSPLVWQLRSATILPVSVLLPPPLNPPDSHCNLVINVFSDKKQNPHPFSFLPLSVFRLFVSSQEKSERCAEDDLRIWPRFAPDQRRFSGIFAHRLLIRVVSDRMLKLGVPS